MENEFFFFGNEKGGFTRYRITGLGENYISAAEYILCKNHVPDGVVVFPFNEGILTALFEKYRALTRIRVGIDKDSRNLSKILLNGNAPETEKIHEYIRNVEGVPIALD